jgi:hypothetical protein
MMHHIDARCCSTTCTSGMRCRVDCAGWDSCVWGLIWGLLERFTSPKTPFSADENHRVPWTRANRTRNLAMPHVSHSTWAKGPVTKARVLSRGFHPHLGLPRLTPLHAHLHRSTAHLAVLHEQTPVLPIDLDPDPLKAGGALDAHFDHRSSGRTPLPLVLTRTPHKNPT